MKLSDALDAFILSRRAENLTSSSITWYTQMLRSFCDSKVDLRALTAADIRRYLADQLEAGYAARTVENRYTALQTFLSWCEDEFDIPSVIGHGRRKTVKRPKVPQKKQQAITHEEFQLLLASIRPTDWKAARDYTILLLLWTTAIRRGSLLGLRLEDVDLESRFALVRAKGRRHVEVPLTKDASMCILGYLYERPIYHGPELWIGSRNNGTTLKPFGETGLRYMIRRRCERAGLPLYTPHAFRRGSATYMLNEGEGVEFVQKLLDHKSSKTTLALYARWTRKGVQARHDALFGRKNV